MDTMDESATIEASNYGTSDDPNASEKIASSEPQEEGLSKFTAFGKKAGGVLKDLTTEAIKTYEKHIQGSFQTGNVVQLVSRASGRTLQITTSPNGELQLDCLGGEGSQYPNALFTVVRQGNNITLHNTYNYLAITDGIVQVVPIGPNKTATKNCELLVKMAPKPYHSKFITIESTHEKERFIGVAPTGHIKSAMVTVAADADTHFAVRLILASNGQHTHCSEHKLPLKHSAAEEPTSSSPFSFFRGKF